MPVQMKVQNDGKTCPLCLSRDVTIGPTGGRVAIDIACPRCGPFSMTWEARSGLDRMDPTPKQRCAASSWLREHPDTALFEADLQRLFSLECPPVGERAEKLLAAIAEQTHQTIGATYQLLFAGEADVDLQALSWSPDQHELRYLMDEYLCNEKKWLTEIQAGNFDKTYAISPRGHDHLDSLRRTVVDSAQGFCAMSFAPETQAAWQQGISPAISAAGYRPMRIDQHEHANRIDDEIIVQIKRSKFVVADFTGQRHGVYFEAGFALALGLRVIWTVRADELGNVHFDNRQYNFITWKEDGLPALQKALTARIAVLLGQGPIAA
jgi:nucleoside 2-deoxyribosyltransferase